MFFIVASCKVFQKRNILSKHESICCRSEKCREISLRGTAEVQQFSFFFHHFFSFFKSFGSLVYCLNCVFSCTKGTCFGSLLFTLGRRRFETEVWMWRITLDWKVRTWLSLFTICCVLSIDWNYRKLTFGVYTLLHIKAC